MKRILAALSVFLLMFFVTVPVMASQHPDRLVDDADLLTNSEKNRLTELLDEISEKHELEIVIVTVDGIGSKTPTAFADDFYDYNGYGYGKRNDGILLLVSMEERDWAISTTGYGIDVFTDAGQEYIMDIVLDDLSNAEYYDAFRSFVNLCDEFITEAENGRPYDVGHMPKGKYPAAMIIISSLGIGFIVAGINNLINRGQLKSVRANNSAVDYVVPGSLDLTEERELFLYHQVSAVKKSSESSSGGGSSTHRSSSGTSHGGSSGKF